MAITYYWRGGAPAVSQVTTATVASSTNGHTFFLKIGGVTIASHTAASDTTSTIATSLASQWNASTHPYASGITAVANSDVISLTADEGGVPFTLQASGGTGTLNLATPTVNAGPCVYSTLTNWIDAATNAAPTALPGAASNDKVIFDDGAISCLWDLDQSAIANSLAEFRQMQTYTGKIGLDYTRFAISADGESYAADGYAEYRQKDLKIKCAAPSANGGGVILGQHDGPGSPVGSTRICLDFTTTATRILVYRTAAQSFDVGRPAVRLLCNHTSTGIDIIAAPGGVGIAADRPGETATLAQLFFASGRLYTGTGVTLSGAAFPKYRQTGGDAVLNFAADPSQVYVSGGTCLLQGVYAVAALLCGGGVTYPNNKAASGSTFATITVDGGICDFSTSPQQRTCDSLEYGPIGGEVISSEAMTFTAIEVPTATGDDILKFRLKLERA